MMDLRRVFELWFDDPQISFTELLKYSERHLQRMIANNPGGFLAARITATTTALNNVEACVTDVGTKAAIQKARTETKNLFRDDLPAGIRRIEGAVIAAYGKGGVDYIECFPEGLQVFSRCRDEELNNKLGVLVNALTPRSATVGEVHLSNATEFKSTWEAIVSAQSAAMGQREASAEQRKADRDTLRLELYKNVLTIALQYPGQPDKCDLYCPQQYLRGTRTPGAPGDATLSAGAWNSTTHIVTLTMQADDATVFTLQRRLVGAPTFETVLDDISADADGNATYDDEIPAGIMSTR